jgi:hypothetical protein
MRTVARAVLLAALASAWGTQVAGAEMKALPAITDPDWKTWAMPTREIGEKIAAAWKVLRENRADRKFATPEEAKAAGEAVQAAYKVLEANAEPACAVGAYYLERTKDDWERLMIGGTLLNLDEKKGEPFFVWSMAKSQMVEALFPAVFQDACFVAEAQRVSDLPGLYWVLKTQKGAVYLPEFDWIIPTHDCMFFVFGRFGAESVPYLRAALRDPDPYVRRNAAVLLGFFLDTESKADLMALLKAGGPPSLGAAFALGEMRDKEALPYVVKLLSSTELNDRLWATYALFEIRAPETLPILEKALAAETNESAKQELTAAVEHIKSINAPGPQALTSDELAKVLKEAEETGSLELPFDRIAASVKKEDLPKLIHLRRLSLDDISDEGHQEFQHWHKIIKTATRGGAVIR